MNPRNRLRALGALPLLAASVLAVLVMSGTAFAQYPSRPIRMIVPVSPGGAPDIVARLIGERLAPLLGQPLVAESRAGSGGNIAMELAARATPDGYTLIICYDAMVVVNPHMYAKMAIDPLKDLVPVAPVAVAHSLFLVANPSLPVRNLQEFIDYARKANPPLAFASGGIGSQHQLAMELLKSRAGINLLHVPYKGGAPAATAVIAGEVPVMFAGSVNIPQMRAGKLRPLAASGAARAPAFPDLQTVGETYPGYRVSTWMGFFGPAGLPEPVLARLRADTARVLANTETRERLSQSSTLDPYQASPEEFAAVIRADYESYGALVRRIGLKAE